MPTRRFELKQGTSQKFWTISQSGKKYTVQFGRIGTEGQTKVKEFESPAKVRAAVEKLVADKGRNGYIEAGGSTSDVLPAKKTRPAKADAKGAIKSMFKELAAVMPPPAKPVYAKGDWGAFEAELGTSLPRDYKQFVAAYGSGYVSELPLCTLSPFSAKPGGNLLLYQMQTKAIHDRLIEAGVFKVPFPLYPANGGLLQWGNTGNADLLYWRTLGPPDHWHIVVCDGSNYSFHSYRKHNFTSFFHAVVTRRIGPFPKVFFEPTPTFCPYKLGKPKKARAKKHAKRTMTRK